MSELGATIPQDEAETIEAEAYKNPWTQDASYWEGELRSSAIKFEGNVPRAAALLTLIAKGMKRVVDLPGMHTPVRLAIGTDDQDVSMVYNPEHGAVIVGKKFLKDYAEFDPDRMQQIERSDGEIVFVGYVNDFMFLKGLEEARHAYYLQDGEEHPVFRDALTMSVAEYEAQPLEFDALLFSLDVAQERQMPQKTIDFLSQSAINAAAVVTKQALTQ